MISVLFNFFVLSKRCSEIQYYLGIQGVVASATYAEKKSSSNEGQDTPEKLGDPLKICPFSQDIDVLCVMHMKL